MRDRKAPSRPGAGQFSSRANWTRAAAGSGSDDSWQLPLNISGDSGPGTKGGLGGEQLLASLSSTMWTELDEDRQRALSLLGRSDPWPCYNRICIRWPGDVWKTFPDKDSGEGYFTWQARAKEEEMEMVVRGRQQKRCTLTLLGTDRLAMANFLRRVLQSCSTVSEDVAHQMNKAVSLLFISHFSLFMHVTHHSSLSSLINLLYTKKHLAR